MKKTKFFKLKFNGQYLLLMTNLLLLTAILTNFTFAKDAAFDFIKAPKLAKIVNVENEKELVYNNALAKKHITGKPINEVIFSDPFIGEIAIFCGNFAPRGWTFCNGQLLAINSNTSLFSILGTTYGGDGRTTFGLPDLRGRVPIHAGQGAGLPKVKLGQKNNGSYVMPYFDDKYNPVLPPSTQAVNYIIALQGTYPTRD